jgi:hypothetical protein
MSLQSHFLYVDVAGIDSGPAALTNHKGGVCTSDREAEIKVPETGRSMSCYRVIAAVIPDPSQLPLWSSRVLIVDETKWKMFGRLTSERLQECVFAGLNGEDIGPLNEAEQYFYDEAVAEALQNPGTVWSPVDF